ncbi:DUF2946 domain-containing protein [Halopseudomonas litoralis]|uniref:DUF2946 domain-containing protein n=1 Tax=Halopseudomonas litoralis TaxID=797277 RepID=UPI000B7D5AFC|nr:DUF2946 domain-containing protein [Halopseudomonas litoralis]
MSIWLGLFAMLMIHVGPLYSALQMEPAAVDASSEPHQHLADGPAPAAQDHHDQASAGEPAWLSALELCGYCELLTLNPPLILSLHLILPRHQLEPFLPLPDAPLLLAERHSGGHARAPPFIV